MDKNKLRAKIRERIFRAAATLPREDYIYPLYVIIEPTNQCNLSCPMCPSKNQTRPKGVMDIALWRRVMDEIARESPQTIVWPAIMGESIIAGERFFTMLEYARSLDLTVVLNTNATLYTRETARRLMSLGLREIIVGLDAFTIKSYRKIRVGGDLPRAIDNTRLFLEYADQTRITVQFIEQEANSEEKDAFIEYWRKLGAWVKLRPRLGWGAGVDAPELILDQHERIGSCPWLLRTVSVHWNGAVVQCDGDWDQKNPAGHLAHSSLGEIWLGELADRRARHRRGDFDFAPCNRCNDWQAGLSQYFSPEGVSDCG